MLKRHTTWRWLALAVVAMTLFSSCSFLMKARVLSVNVKVVDENDVPIKGALVEVTDGQKATTGDDGLATLKFAGLGMHMITVMAQDRAPATLSVTMPVDIGKTLTARLGEPVEMSVHYDDLGLDLSGVSTLFFSRMFQALFTAYGYDLELVPLKEGEWTDWEYDYSGDKVMLHKAFLKRLANGQEWWQMIFSDDEGGDAVNTEVLFSTGRQSLRRMRQKTGDEEPHEVPVKEGWYAPPMSLTPESIEGAVTKKGVSVTVPAGSFKADLLEFAAMGAGTIRMWRAEGVPGGVVRTQLVDPSGETLWTSELKAHGTGAKTALNSY